MLPTSPLSRPLPAREPSWPTSLRKARNEFLAMTMLTPEVTSGLMIYLTMKLLTWNIRHGGGTRLPCIVEELAAYDADVIALTEYRARPGKELRSALFERGWLHVET